MSPNAGQVPQALNDVTESVQSRQVVGTTHDNGSMTVAVTNGPPNQYYMAYGDGIEDESMWGLQTG